MGKHWFCNMVMVQLQNRNHILLLMKICQAGKYQYRLKQIDFDGTFEYSNTIEVEIGLPQNFL